MTPVIAAAPGMNGDLSQVWAHTTGALNSLWDDVSGSSPPGSETQSGSSPRWADTSGLSPGWSGTFSHAWADADGSASASTFADLQTVGPGGEERLLQQGAGVLFYPGYQELAAWPQEQVGTAAAVRRSCTKGCFRTGCAI